jgi:O-acetyl-ADP-ribose deacetylase (regulator of RNase III)
MLERAVGNLLEADVDALVNTVNTVGVMGKGIALQFKRAFPDNFAVYERACRAGEVEVGRMLVVERLASPRYIINFPTKKHWSRPSQLSYVKDGLVDLVEQVRRLGIRSIAIPPLGAGNGGLPWDQVRPLIEDAFAPIEDVRVLLYEPRSAPSPGAMPDRTVKPRMTPGRAAILALMHRYRATGYDYRLSLVEVQKLAYFLQTEGEPLKREFRPYLYGPYADALRKVLRHIEGHYTQGVGDGRNSPTTEISLLPGAAEEAEAFLRRRGDCGRSRAAGWRVERAETVPDEAWAHPCGVGAVGGGGAPTRPRAASLTDLGETDLRASVRLVEPGSQASSTRGRSGRDDLGEEREG